MPAIVNSGAVSEALNLTGRRVEQLVQEGMPRIGRGKYDLWACARWYIRYLQQAMERRATDPDTGSPRNLTEEKKRLLRLQGDMAEIELRKKMSELIPAHLVDDKFVTFAGTVHDRILALPSRIALGLVGESREVIRVKLYEAVRDTLNSLSNQLKGKLAASKQNDTKKQDGSDKPKRKTRRSPFTGSIPGRTKTRRRS